MALKVETVQKYAVTYKSEKYNDKLTGFFDDSPGVVAFDITWRMIRNKYGDVGTKEFPKRGLPKSAYKAGYPRYHKEKKLQNEDYIGRVSLRLLRMILPDVMKLFKNPVQWREA